MDTKKRIDRLYTTFSRVCFTIFWRRYKWAVVRTYFFIFAVFAGVGFLAIKVWNDVLITLFAVLIIMGYEVEPILFFCLSVSDSLVFVCVIMVVVPCIISTLLCPHIIKEMFLKGNSFKHTNPQYRIALRHLQLQLRTVVDYKNPGQIISLFDQLQHSQKTTRRLNELLNEIQKAQM